MDSKIIVYDKSEFNADNGQVVFRASINNDAIYRSALYWDKILIPKNDDGGIIDISHEPWINELTHEGVIERPLVRITSHGITKNNYFDSHMEFVKNTISKTDAYYSVYDLESTLKKRKDIINGFGGEIFTLANALPAPAPGVNVTEVLEFKHRRKDNLKLLMTHLNEIENRVLRSENRSAELKSAINEIDMACADVIRLHKEAGLRFNLSSLRLNFSIEDIFKMAGIAYGGALEVGMQHTSAVVVGLTGGIASILKIEASISLNTINPRHPFNYVGYTAKELK